MAPSLSEGEVGGDKQTIEQPEAASTQGAPQVFRKAPGKIPKWLKLPGINESWESSSAHSELPPKASSCLPNVLDIDGIVADVSLHLQDIWFNACQS